MQLQVRPPRHHYRLLLDDDRQGCAQRIEFEAPDTRQALSVARSCLSGRKFKLYKDEKLLGQFSF